MTLDTEGGGGGGGKGRDRVDIMDKVNNLVGI